MKKKIIAIICVLLPITGLILIAYFLSDKNKDKTLLKTTIISTIIGLIILYPMWMILSGFIYPKTPCDNYGPNYKLYDIKDGHACCFQKIDKNYTAGEAKNKNCIVMD